MTDQLPTRPRVVADLPILRRRHGELQIGLDPRHAAVVDGLPDTVVAAALRLTGHRTGEEVLAGLDPADRDAMRELLAALSDRGLLEDATSLSKPPPPRLAGDVAAARLRAVSAGQPPESHPIGRHKLAIAVHGDGRLAVAVACLLASAGVGWVHVAAAGRVRPEDTGTGYLHDDIGSPRRVAARRALHRVDATVRKVPFTAARAPDLVILTDALVPPPEQVNMLTAQAVPHLMVRVRDTTGIVGPLVVPGLTSCLHCADLHRCDRDACWPQLATQLAGHVRLTDLAGTHATAAFAAAQALDAAGWLRGLADRPATCETSVELDLRTATVRHREWSAHAACSCGAARRQSPGQAYCSKVAADPTDKLRQSGRDGDAS